MYIATLKGRNFAALKVQFTFFQNSLKFSYSLLFKVFDTLQQSHDKYLTTKSRRVIMEGRVGFLELSMGEGVYWYSAKSMGQFTQRRMDKVKLSVVAWVINDSQIF